jgi:hypothetical protein
MLEPLGDHGLLIFWVMVSERQLGSQKIAFDWQHHRAVTYRYLIEG